MDEQGLSDSVCPFCPFSDPDSTHVTEHVQYCHPENGSRDDSDHEKSGTRLEDPASTLYGNAYMSLGRAEYLQSVAFMTKEHQSTSLDKHQPVRRTQPRSEHTQDRSAHHNLSRVDGHKISPLPSKQSTTVTERMKTLGRAELGPYAHEKKMPSWLLRMLEKGNTTTNLTKITQDGRLSRHVIIENETPNIIPALAQLCIQDKTVTRAFLCSSHVHHISKIPREGSFCGYRNIQMLVSYLQGSRSPGSEHFPGALPTILQLQDMIEHAWDSGYNSVGRTETGGIKGTRKYIGTSEAQALFLSLGIQCEAGSIGKTKDLPAHSALLSQIATYFRSACPFNNTDKVTLTSLPPIYFQHHGHSMTIVGLEIRDQGKANLLVLDPAVKTPSLIKHTTSVKISTSDPAHILKGYRKDVKYLQKYQIFELLRLLPPGIPPEN